MTETLAEKTCTPVATRPATRADEARRFQGGRSRLGAGDDAHRIQRTFRFRNFEKRSPLFRKSVSLPRPKAITRHQLRLGLCDSFPEHQEDKRIARERFYRGEQDRSGARSLGPVPRPPG